MYYNYIHTNQHESMCFFIMLFQCSILKYEFPFFTYKVAFPVSFQLHSNRGEMKTANLYLYFLIYRKPPYF